MPDFTPYRHNSTRRSPYSPQGYAQQTGQGGFDPLTANIINAQQGMAQHAALHPQYYGGGQPRAPRSGTAPHQPGVFTAGEQVHHIQRADGALIPVSAATGDPYLVRRKGGATLHSPVTGEEFGADPTSPTGVSSLTRARAEAAAAKVAQAAKKEDAKTAVALEKEKTAQGKEAAKEAEATHKLENARATDALIREGRAYNINRETGKPLPKQSDEEFAAEKKDKMQKLQQAAARKPIKGEIDRIKHELDNPDLPAVKDKDVKDAQDAMSSAAAALQAARGTNDYDAPVTDKEVEEALADPARRPAAAAYIQAKKDAETLPKVLEQRKKLQRQLYDLEGRALDPLKYGQELKARLGTASDDDLHEQAASIQAQAQARHDDLQKNAGDLQQKDADLASQHANAAANYEKAKLSGDPNILGAAGDALQGIEQNAEQWLSDTTDRRAAIDADHQELTRDQEHLKLVDAEMKRRRDVQVEQHATSLEQAAPGSGQQYKATLADARQRADALRAKYSDPETTEAKASFSALEKDIHGKIGSIVNKAAGSQQTIAQVYEGMRAAAASDIKANNEKLTQAMPGFKGTLHRGMNWLGKNVGNAAPLAAASPTFTNKGWYESGAKAMKNSGGMISHEAVAEVQKSLDISEEQATQVLNDVRIANYNVHAKAARAALKQSLGITDEQAQTMLDDHEKTDWRGAGTALASKDVVASLIKAAGGKPGTMYVESEPTRLLSDGRITVNPKLVQYPDIYAQAVKNSGATPEKQAQAMKELPDARQQLGKHALELFQAYSGSGFNEWLAKQPKLKDSAPVDQALAYADHLRDNTGPIGKLLDQVVTRLQTGVKNIGVQGLGMYALATGSESAAKTAGNISKGIGQQMGMLELSGANESLLNRTVGTTADIAPGVLVTMGAGIAARGATIAFAGTKIGAEILAKISGVLAKAATAEEAAAAVGHIANTAGFYASAAAGGAQTAGAQFSDTYAALRDQGYSHEDAVKTSRMPALISGAVTALLTVSFGKTGKERIFADPATKAAAKTKFRSLISGIVKGGLEEQPEELFDELYNQVSTEMVSNPHANLMETVQKFVDQLPELALSIGVMGGAGGGRQALRDWKSNDQPTPEDMGPEAAQSSQGGANPEDLAAVGEQISAWTPPDKATLPNSIQDALKASYGKDATPEQTAEVAQRAAHALVAIGQGKDPRTMSVEVRRVLGIKMNSKTGAIEPASNGVMPMVESVADSKGNHQAVILDSAREWLSKALPDAGATIKLDYAGRVAQIQQPPAEPVKKPVAKKPAAAQTPVSTEQPVHGSEGVIPQPSPAVPQATGGGQGGKDQKQGGLTRDASDAVDSNGNAGESPAPAPSAKLPKELASAKPAYSYGEKQFKLEFENDADRAAYITAQATPSKRDADYLAFAMKATGMTGPQVRAHGATVRTYIKGHASTGTHGDTILIPSQIKAPQEKPQPAKTPDVPHGTDTQAHTAATSPNNDLPQPSEPQTSATPEAPARETTRLNLTGGALIQAVEKQSQKTVSSLQGVEKKRGSAARDALLLKMRDYNGKIPMDVGTGGLTFAWQDGTVVVNPALIVESTARDATSPEHARRMINWLFRHEVIHDKIVSLVPAKKVKEIWDALKPGTRAAVLKAYSARLLAAGYKKELLSTFQSGHEYLRAMVEAALDGETSEMIIGEGLGEKWRALLDTVLAILKDIRRQFSAVQSKEVRERMIADVDAIVTDVTIAIRNLEKNIGPAESPAQGTNSGAVSTSGTSSDKPTKGSTEVVATDGPTSLTNAKTSSAKKALSRPAMALATGAAPQDAGDTALNDAFKGLFAPPQGPAAPKFYSHLSRVISQKMPVRADANAVKGMVGNQSSGVKAEEIKWSGILPWLEGKQGLIAKADVLEYLRSEGAVRFEEHRLGAKPISFDDWADENRLEDHPDTRQHYADMMQSGSLRQEDGGTKYSQYQLPGGNSNYREVVLAMPRNNRFIVVNNKTKAETPFASNEEAIAYSAENRTSGLGGEFTIRHNNDSTKEYTSSHFPDVPNYVAHMRLNERTDAEGKEGLFIEEVQSDRHQQGREKGYVKDDLPNDWKIEKYGNIFHVKSPNGDIQAKGESEAEAKKIALGYLNNGIIEGYDKGIPDAPYRTTWPLQLFKRALAEAVSTGKAWVGWTTGSTQAERYDMSQQVDSIGYLKTGDAYTIEAVKDGQVAMEKEALSAKELADYIGKELAQKIVNGEGHANEDADEDTPEGMKVLSGLDLKVGGEGMKGFYDNILTKEVGKYVKQWGAGVKQGGIPKEGSDGSLPEWDVTYSGEATQTVYNQDRAEAARELGAKVIERRVPDKDWQTPIWRVDITPAMKAGVEAGQALFAPQSPPASFTEDLPADRMEAMMKAARTLVDLKLTTPQELGTRFDKMDPSGNARRYSAAFWNLLKAFDGKLPDVKDWTAIYDSVPKSQTPAKISTEPSEEVSAKEQDEAKELEITQAARAIVQEGGTPSETYGKLVELYQNQPTLSAKTSTSKVNQAYSTPAPMAYLVSRMVDMTGGKVVAEPTAGNGMLLIERKPGQTILVNEIDPKRRLRLNQQLIAATGEDATTWTPAITPDRVIANPPFGQVMEEGGGNKTFDTPAGPTTSIDHAIMLRSLESMAPDGRAVFIIGGPPPTVRSPKARAEYYRAGKTGSLMAYLYANYKVVDHFTAAGDLYKKQGAGWPLDIILIAGKGRSELALPGRKAPRILTTWENLSHELDRTDDARLEENRIKESDLRGDVDKMAGELAGLGGAPRKSGRNGDRQPGQDSPGDVRLPADDAGSTDAGGLGAAGDVRPSGNAPAGEPDQRGRSLRAGDVASDYQTHYEPVSGINPAGLLAPINLELPMRESLNKLRDEVGPLPEYVRSKLGYPKGTDLAKYFFGDQIDGIAQAISQAEKGGALVVGDQTGTGKGRMVAALMKYAIKNGQIPVFVTKDQVLYDAMLDDLQDIDAGEVVPYITDADLKEKVFSERVRKIKATNGAAVGKTIASTGKLPKGINAIFTSYYQIKADDQPGISKQERARAKADESPPPGYWRMEMLRRLAPNAFFILDESHLASGKSTTGWRAGELLASAKNVYYSSATFAKRPDNMGIYFRTNLNRVGGSMGSLIELMEHGGVPAMQAASSMLAADGQYLRRERSFAGVKFQTQVMQPSYERDKALADNYTEGLRVITEVQERMQKVADAVNDMLASVGKKYRVPSGNRARLEASNFSAKLHNMVSQYLFSIKADSAAEAAIKAIQNGEKVIVTVENTMESAIDQLQAWGLPLTFNGLLQLYLNQQRTFTTKQGGFGRPSETWTLPKEGNPLFEEMNAKELQDRAVVQGSDAEGKPTLSFNGEVVEEMMFRAMSGVFDDAQADIEAIKIGDMPLSPIDRMRQRVEDAGIRTAEMTGRSFGIDRSGKVYERSKDEIKGKMAAKDAFNNSDTHFLVINKTGSTGVSMHSSPKFGDTRPRRMIVVQPNLDINEFMQTLGRIHRAGQLHLPSYTLLQTALPAEKRPAAILGIKMGKLNANTTSNADSEVSQKEQQDLFNEYGDEEVWKYLSTHLPLARIINQSWSGKIMSEDGKLLPLSHFRDAENGGGDGYLSRGVTGHLALLPVDDQEMFWESVESGYKALISFLNETGQNNLKAEAIDLKAKTTSKEVFTAGEPGGDSVFSLPSYLETVDTTLGEKPIDAEEATKQAEKASGTVDKTRTKFLDRANQFIEEEEKAKALKQNNWEGEKKENWLQEQRAQRDEIASAIGQIGTFGKLDRHDGTFGAAFVESIKFSEKFPNRPSEQKVRLIINDSRTKLDIPISKLADIFQPITYGEQEHWKTSYDYGSTRSIVTGNILAALKDLDSGRVITYTTHDGKNRIGILLPQDYTARTQSEKGRRIYIETPERFTSALDNGHVVRNETEAVEINKSQGSIAINVPKSRAAGGKYWRDPGLLKLIERGEFVDSGRSSDQFIAYISAENAAAVFTYLKNGGETFHVVNTNALGAPPSGRDDPDSIRNAQRIPTRGLFKSDATHGKAYVASINNRARAGQIIRSFERDWAPFFTYIDDTAPKDKRKAALNKIIDRFGMSDSAESKSLWKWYSELPIDGLVPEDTERVKEAKELLPYLENLTLGAPAQPNAGVSRVAAEAAANLTKPGNTPTGLQKLFITGGTAQPIGKGQGTGALFTTKSAAPAFQTKDLHAAYQRALKGSSTASVTIRSVFDEAKKSMPSLTAAEFKSQLKADYYGELVGLEYAGDVEKAGQFTMRDSLGVVHTNMVFMPTNTAEMIEAADRDERTPADIMQDLAGSTKETDLRQNRDTLAAPPVDPAVANQGNTPENREAFGQQRGRYITEDLEQADFDEIRTRMESEVDANEQEHLDNILYKVENGEELTLEEEVARRILANRLRTRGTLEDDANLIQMATRLWGQDITSGSDTARKLAMRVDQFESPQDRLNAAIGRIIAPNLSKLRARTINAWTPSAKRREIARLRGEIASADTQLARERFERKLAEAQARLDKDEEIQKLAAENEKQVDKVLARLGLAASDIHLMPEDRRSMQLAVLDMPHVRRHIEAQTPEVQKAIEMSVRGYSDDAIARDTGLPMGKVERVTEDFRTNIAKQAISQTIRTEKQTFGGLIEAGKALFKWILKAPAQPLGHMVNAAVPNAANIQNQVLRILNAAIPTRRQRNRRTLKAVKVNGKNGQKITVFIPYDPSDWKQVYRAARELSTRDATYLDKAYEYWINGILSGIQTHVVNTASNLLSTAWHYGPQWAASATVNTFVRDPNSTQWGEFPRLLGGFLKGIGPAMKNFALAWETEADPVEYQYLDKPVTAIFNGGRLDKIGGRGPAIGGAPGRVVRVPGRFLVAADAFAKTLIMHGESAAHAYRLGKDKGLAGAALENYIASQIATYGSDSWAHALETATELTFQDENEITKNVEKVINSAKQMKVVGLLFKYLIPFVRTPTNVYRTGSRKAGGSAGMLLWRLGQAGFFKMKDGTPFFDSYSKGKMVKDISESVMAGIMWMGLMALSEGGDDDDDKTLTITGARPYGVANAGERASQLRQEGGSNLIILRRNPLTGKKLDEPLRIPYGRYEPMALAVGSIVDAAREYKEWTRNEPGSQRADKLAGTIMAHLVAQAQDKTFLQGISSLAQIAEDITTNRMEPGQALAKQVVNGVVPNMVRQIFSKTKELLPDSKKPHAVLGSTTLGITLSDTEPKINEAGKPVTRTAGKITSALFPVATAPSKELFDGFLKDWNNRYPSAAWNPDPLTKGDWYIYDPQQASKKGKMPLTAAKSVTRFESMVGINFSHNAAAALIKLGYHPGTKPTEAQLEAVKDARTAAIKTVRAMPPSVFTIK